MCVCARACVCVCVSAFGVGMLVSFLNKYCLCASTLPFVFSKMPASLVVKYYELLPRVRVMSRRRRSSDTE